MTPSAASTPLDVLRMAARYYDAASHEGGARAALSDVETLVEAARELEESVSGALGSMAHYFGPNSRTAVSKESSDRFLRIQHARNETRDALARFAGDGNERA